VPAVTGLGPCFLDGFTSPKPSRSRQFLKVDAPTPPAASVISGLTLGNPNVWGSSALSIPFVFVKLRGPTVTPNVVT